ncbi:protein of unknown function DUF2431 [Macleaya cordata]|uniref:25S rRNA (uridine-N(3))-methyltransferase BMT5-like domain-containing protein n=1 Tax=Macleaya cordata TaxID=56857 RepID=A0A200PM04_MACCD|nr:protein of unknown function DUF2431 [Macleaya cordata]
MKKKDEEEDGEEEDEEEEEEEREKWINHYSTSQRILLVGEGDFSFSLCLANAFGSATNMVSTSIDTQESLSNKYGYAIGNVRELEEKGCLVLLGVDATQMSQHFFLRTQRFDRIVYNFPHVGFLYRENSHCQIELNKRLVKGFLKNAKELIREKGEIHVTHKKGEPYDQWKIERKAEKIGLVLKECVPFRKQDYPGYANKRAHGNLSDLPFPLGDCITFKFKLQN